MVASQRESIVFRVDPKLLQHRPPRLTLAATLNTLGQRVQSNELTANVVVDILDENRLLPYIIRNIKNLHIVSLGQITNASKIGDIIVSEECIRGSYELCLAFLRFVLIIVKSEDYVDSTKTMLASVTYIANEIYPNHHIWTYKNISDMYEILGLCTDIFYQIIVKSPVLQCDKQSQETTNKPTPTQPSDLDVVCIINLSQNQAHKQLLDVIVEGKQLIKKVISDPEFKGESSLEETPIVLRTRQSLSIFHKLLTRSEYIKHYYESQNIVTEQHLDGSTANYQNIPMTNIERALFDTSIRPGLLQHLFSYIYQKEDSHTACLAVELIKKIAEKFSMSLMASLGSEADRVCEFFIDCLDNKESNMDLKIAIVDLLSTCVRHQPGLIELFLNFDRDTQPQTADVDKQQQQQLKSLQVIMDLLKECRSQQTDVHRSLHTYVMKFILTFWQKCHSAIEQFDAVDDFWELITHPLVHFLDSPNSIPTNETYSLSEALNDKLNSYALMILAREIYNVNAGVNDRKINAKLSSRLQELASKNLISKYSVFVVRRYSGISNNLDKCDYYNRILAGWRDFLASYAKYLPFEASSAVRSQIIETILNCLSVELRLGEKLSKERLASIGETLLLTWTKWMSGNASSEKVFQLIHELLYLADSCRDYLPFSFLLTFQSALNLYLMRERDYLLRSKRSFDLLVPAAELMQFSLKIMERYVNQMEMQQRQRDQGPNHQQQPQKQEHTDQSNGNQQRATTSHHETSSGRLDGGGYKPGVESRLCQASIMTLRYIIDVARPHVDLWINYLQTNLKTDYLVHFLTLMMTKRTGSDVCISMVELLLCLSSIEQTADYLNKRALISQLNIVTMSSYDRLLPNQTIPLTRSSVATNVEVVVDQQRQQQASGNSGSLNDANTTDVTWGKPNESLYNKQQNQQGTTVDADKTITATGQQASTSDTQNNENKSSSTFLDNAQNLDWLAIYRHVIRLNISMILTLRIDYIPTAVEFLSLHRIRICELIELLRTRPRLVNMEEALQTIYLINLVLRHGCMWIRRNRHSYETIGEEIAKTAYTLATSALPPPVTETSGDPASSQTAQHTSLKPRDCLIYARCCYDFGRYTEAERVLFQTKYGDKDGFIEEAAQIYGAELSDYAFHLAALICLKTNRQGDSIDFALQVFSDDQEQCETLHNMSRSRILTCDCESQIILVLAVAAAAAATLQVAAAFEIKDCAANRDPYAKMLSFNVDTCPDAAGRYCTFVKGKDATMTVEVISSSSDACRAYGFICPAKVGEMQRMVVSLRVLRIYPPIKTTVRAELRDEKKNPIACVELPVQIKTCDTISRSCGIN